MQKILLMSAVLVSLSACGDRIEPTQTQRAEHYIQQSLTHAKPGAALALTNSQVNLPLASVQYAVNVDINSDYAEGDMALSVSTSDGLFLIEGELTQVVPLKKGVIRLPYELFAVQSGRYYLYINATINKGNKTTARAMALIVQVGEEQQKTVNDRNNSHAEKIKILPAQEEIIR